MDLSRLLGLVLVLVVVLIWVASSFLTQGIYDAFPRPVPFFLTYFNTASFVVFLLPRLLRWFIGLVRGQQAKEAWDARGKALSARWTSFVGRARLENEKLEHPERDIAEAAGLAEDEDVLSPDRLRSSRSEYPLSPSPISPDSEHTLEIPSPSGGSSLSPNHPHPANPAPPKPTHLLALQFCLLWFSANYLSNLALSLTSVSSSTILSSTSGLFTLLLDRLLNGTPVHAGKLGAVLLSLCGVILVSWDDRRESLPRTVPGDLAALCSALFYALYSLLLSKLPAEASPGDFLGMVGVWNLAILWPAFFPLSILDLEPFPSHVTLPTLAALLSNALIGSALSDLLWMLAVLLTTPLIVTVGLSLTIPLAILGDAAKRGVMPSVWHVVGGGLVVAGFVGVNLGSGGHGEAREDGFARLEAEEGAG